MAVLSERSAEYENTCDAALWLIGRKYLYKYIQMRHRKKTVIVIIIIIIIIKIIIIIIIIKGK